MYKLSQISFSVKEKFVILSTVLETIIVSDHMHADDSSQLNFSTHCREREECLALNYCAMFTGTFSMLGHQIEKIIMLLNFQKLTKVMILQKFVELQYADLNEKDITCTLRNVINVSPGLALFLE